MTAELLKGRGAAGDAATTSHSPDVHEVGRFRGLTRDHEMSRFRSAAIGSHIRRPLFQRSCHARWRNGRRLRARRSDAAWATERTTSPVRRHAWRPACASRPRSTDLRQSAARDWWTRATDHRPCHRTGAALGTGGVPRGQPPAAPRHGAGRRPADVQAAGLPYPLGGAARERQG